MAPRQLDQLFACNAFSAHFPLATGLAGRWWPAREPARVPTGPV